MAPLDSGPHGRRPMPEELVLLCTDPAHGRMPVPAAAFYRALTGGVLAELVLAGAVAVEDRRITGFRPLGAQDEITAGVLDRLAEAGKWKHRLGLDHVMRQIPRREALGHFRERLVAEGVLTVERRRVLLVPYRAHLPVPATAGQEIADRIARALGRTGAGTGGTAASPGGAGGPDGPDLQLAGLIGAARLDRRIFPGPENTEVRKAARRLVKELPVARAVRRLVDADNASGG
ncbi:GPP34 family phosphoprotein [Streptomyces sp. BE20]|uniref:GOLPH3/VPS74 family protein n=1 Tax=Streptomyces sp. BE20 TaxID=3002525 RepID=UPI002E7A2330|nr:GPP34 family phosphoprotein [Streptomyces sp. BE20]MEE1827521.1 GPP34 family phosphoprotein [Streptomyces sp. BE20]